MIDAGSRVSPRGGGRLSFPFDDLCGSAKGMYIGRFVRR